MKNKLTFILLILLSINLVPAVEFIALGHTYSDAEALRLSVPIINEENPDFVIFLGDSIYLKDWKPASCDAEIITSWEMFFNITKDINVPIYFAAGNHDIIDPYDLREEYIKDISELNYKFELENITFFVVDSVHGIEPDYDVTDYEIKLIKEEYKSDNKKVILMSQVLFPYNGMVGIKNKNSINNKWNKEVVPIIKDKTIAVITGDGAYKIPYFHYNIEGINYFGGGFSQDYEMLPQHLLKITIDKDLKVEPIAIRKDISKYDYTKATKRNRLSNIKLWVFDNFRGFVMLVSVSSIVIILTMILITKQNRSNVNNEKGGS